MIISPCRRPCGYHGYPPETGIKASMGPGKPAQYPSPWPFSCLPWPTLEAEKASRLNSLGWQGIPKPVSTKPLYITTSTLIYQWILMNSPYVWYFLLNLSLNPGKIRLRSHEISLNPWYSMAQIPSAQRPTCISPGPAAAVASDRSSPSVLAPWNKHQQIRPKTQQWRC